MNVYDAINARRTLRDFDGRAVDAETAERIIGAGLRAPTNDHMRSWEFVIVNDKKVRAEILEIIPKTASSGDINSMLDGWGMTNAGQRNMYLDAVPKQYAMLYNAGLLILPFFRDNGELMRPKSIGSLNGFASMWCCIENILVAAASEGVFGVTRIPSDYEREHIKSVIRHPDDYVLPCYMGLGYPSKDAAVHTQNDISVKDRIHTDGWRR